MNRLSWIVAISLTLAALALSAALYSRLPEQVPIHWNIQGQVDDYGHKSWAAFLMPGMMAALLGLFALLPWLSPKRFEVQAFKSTYLFVMLLTIGLSGYLHALMLWAALGNDVDVGRAVVAGVCLFFVLLGNVLGKVRRNFYVGVRTPWTLASERVWNDTHRLAAWLFAGFGVVGFVLALLPVPLFCSLIALGVPVVVTIFYSLIHYKRLERRGEV